VKKETYKEVLKEERRRERERGGRERKLEVGEMLEMRC
jgi:hypothetical protein